MRVAFFEDAAADGLLPLTWLRPTFELLCGHYGVRERALHALPVEEWGAFCRPYLYETYRESFPAAYVGDEVWLSRGPTLLVNGRWLGSAADLGKWSGDAVGMVGDEIAWVVLDPLEAPLLGHDRWDDGLASLARTRRRVEAGGVMARHPWDLVNANPSVLTADFADRLRRTVVPSADPPTHLGLVGSARDLYIDPTAKLDPFVVLDTTHGPIWIDAGAVVQAFTRIEGPCYVGPKSQLFRTNLREGSSIGPVCRVGGEVEGSILHGYANKYHDGFLGHSYVCPWVNLGALTTNSDLKNDYSNVSVPLVGESVPTGTMKAGCYVGDHTKTGLGSLFNTGSSVGVMSMILPAGELLPKHIPSFTRVWHGRLEEFPTLEQVLDTARTAMDRRKMTLTPAGQRLLQHVYRLTAGERDRAFGRQASRAAATVGPS